MTLTRHHVATAGSLVVGAALWWTIGAHGGISPLRAGVLIGAAMVAATPALRDPVAAALDCVRNPSPRGRRRTAASVSLIACAYLLFTAWYQGRDLIPKFHDEHMHLLQTQMLAHGRLWMPPHPLADFFETFHVFVRPVYAAIYFPGTAIMYAPFVWLHLPFWWMPLIVASLCVGMCYLVTTRVIDGVAGLLAALLLLSLQWFRYVAFMVMSQPVMLLLGLSMVWAWLHWRDATGRRKLAWAAAIGALMGWAAITRPVDAICYAAPVGVMMLIELRRAGWKQIAITLGLIALCAAPFLSLQLIENKALTGDVLESPYRRYADLYTPQMSFGFHDFDPAIRPQTTLPQRQIYYDEFTVPAARAHRADRIVHTWFAERFPEMAKVTLPNRLLLLLLPASLLALWSVPRRTLWIVLPLYTAMYAMFAYLLEMYLVVIAPVVIFWALLGKESLERAGGRRMGERSRTAAVALTLAIAGLAIAALPEIDHEIIDDGFLAPTMWFNYVELPKNVEAPAIVLYRFRPGDNVNEEPVYNIDAASPDDAPIIRAHDLGVDRNRELFAYYAARQPTRMVYLYDRAKHQLAPLGNVADLSRRFPATQRGLGVSAERQ
jgi:hypothetical protein